MSAARGTVCLRRFPVEGIDILSSGVAEQQRRIVGRESQRSSVTSDRNEILQVDHLFCLMVADSNSEDARLSPRIQNINVLSGPRPIRVAKDALASSSPLFHLEVEQYQVARPNAQCENYRPSAAIGARKAAPASGSVELVVARLRTRIDEAPSPGHHRDNLSPPATSSDPLRAGTSGMSCRDCRPRMQPHRFWLNSCQ